MPTARKTTRAYKKPNPTPIMPSASQVETARQSAKAAPDVTPPGIVYGVDGKEWATYVVDVRLDDGAIAAMRNKLAARGYIELEDGPHAVSGYALGAHVFVIKQSDAAENFRKRAAIALARRQ